MRKQLIKKLPLLLFSFLLSCSENQIESKEEKFVEFYSVQEINLHLKGSGHPQFDPAKMREAAKKERARVVSVLVYYGVPVRFTSEGKITIPESYAGDTEFLFELLGKARDTAWYKQHIISADN